MSEEMEEEEEEVEFETLDVDGGHTCGRGHRSSLFLRTREGGGICLVCLSALLSSPSSPTVHVSYALSQLSLASRDPALLLSLRTCHAHVLVQPLVWALASYADDQIARQLIDLVSDLCGFGSGSGSGSAVSADFVARISDQLSESGAIGWNRRHVYSLHCLGILLDSHQDENLTSHIRDKTALFSNLVTGLQLPSEEVRGEILFVLYKLSVLQATPWDGVDGDLGNADSYLAEMRLRVVRLPLEVLLKTQHDDVRMNCLALLMVLAQRGFFENLFSNGQSSSSFGEADNNSMQTDETVSQTPLIILFADAVKGPLLSSDAQVQIRTLDLIFHTLSSEVSCARQIQALVEENIADYVFEILRLSGNKDPLVISCLQVLILLTTAEEAFQQRLAIGFPTILSVLRYVSEIPFHPVQSPVLKLVWSCISKCPGVVSISQVEEIALILTGILRSHSCGEMGMLSETFVLSCSTFVEILKSPSASGMQKIAALAEEASRNMLLSTLSAPQGTPNLLLLYSLYLLKEAHIYSLQASSNTNSDNVEQEKSIIETCKTYLLPWLERATDEGEEEEVILDVLETFHLILLRGSEVLTKKFAETLASSSWFSLSFGFLGLFPSDQMKLRVYLMLSSVFDKTLGPDFGQPIRDTYVHLPLDPLEMLFLMGQRSSHDPNLNSCQRAVLQMLYVSSLYGDSLADDNQVLASLEQYVLVNGSNFLCGVADSIMLTQLINLYGLIRGASIGHRTSYSLEAERALFDLVSESEWELLSTGTHPVAFKWLFQQEGLLIPLANQILNFCRFYSTNKIQINFHATNIPIVDIHMIAKLVVSGDNCLTKLLLSLLKKLQEEGGREDDTTYVVNAMTGILNIYPEASNQFCLQRIDDALCDIYSSMHSSCRTFLVCSLLVFNILYSAHHRAISQDGEWLAVTIKLLDFAHCKLAPQPFGQEGHSMLGIFCLILHHSANQVLKAASKAILQNKMLVETIDCIVQAACAKGPALADHDEETGMREGLIFVLLLYSFSLKSLHATLQESLDWQDLFQSSKEVKPSSVLMCIKCHDLCRLMHFGSSLVKLVASECLVELLTRISEQRIRKQDEIRCSLGYLKSMMAITEGLVFFGDSKVATNCSICLSIMFGWEKLGFLEKRAVGDSKWCRLILEELTITLAAPSLASKCFSNQHKPAAYIAVALLRLDEVPGWMKSVFNISCISGIIDSLSASNVTPEMVMLFRELMSRKYLNEEQVARLHQLFQVCREQVYTDTSQGKFIEQSLDKVVAVPDVIGKLCSQLIHLMMSPLPVIDSRLLEEVDIFFQESCTHY